MHDSNAKRSSTRTGSQSIRAVSLAARDVEQRLTRGESVLLLGAFMTLAASMATFVTL